MIIENCLVKVRLLNIKYGPSNKNDKNDLRYNIFVEKEEDGQIAINFEIEKEIYSLV